MSDAASAWDFHSKTDRSSSVTENERRKSLSISCSFLISLSSKNPSSKFYKN
jgi:hypothetical protein